MVAVIGRPQVIQTPKEAPLSTRLNSIRFGGPVVGVWRQYRRQTRVTSHKQLHELRSGLSCLAPRGTLFVPTLEFFGISVASVGGSQLK